MLETKLDRVSEIRRLVVEAHEAGTRVDKFVAVRMGDVTRAAIQRWIDSERVLLEGRTCRAKDRVRLGDVVEVAPDAPPPTSAVADPSVVFDVIFEDAELLVVNKPPGLVVHPARGHQTGTLVNGLLARPGFERPACDPLDPDGQFRPGIVHRIDKDTSGLLVVAKSELAREHLKAQLAEHSMERKYVALTVGVPRARRIETLHGRDPRNRLRFSSQVSEGKRAVTKVRVLESLGGGRAAWIECELETGRTHQIRVHLSLETRTPLLGDELYGGLRGAPEVVGIARSLGRQALHAMTLGFVHPRTGERLSFSAPIPSDIQAARSALQLLSEP